MERLLTLFFREVVPDAAHEDDGHHQQPQVHQGPQHGRAHGIKAGEGNEERHARGREGPEPAGGRIPRAVELAARARGDGDGGAVEDAEVGLVRAYAVDEGSRGEYDGGERDEEGQPRQHGGTVSRRGGAGQAHSARSSPARRMAE
jgi:hypothetical protein